MAYNPPNILFITTDQQRYDTCGPMAPDFLRTPHFDHLCREGIRFDKAYADCPICVPSRTSMMTGKYVFTHGMDRNGETSDVMGHENTLPACLHNLGYQTAAIGKMHFGPQRVRHGFDEMIIPDDYYRAMSRSGNSQQPMRHGLGQNELYPGMATVPENLTLTSWTAEQCVEYIKARHDPTRPFFLWCSFSKPHPPFDPPEPYYSMYRDADIPAPDFGDWSEDDACPEPFKRFRQMYAFDRIPPEIIKEARAAYYGLITQIDYNMGRVFAALQDIGLFDDTLIVYTSDHGEYLGDHHTGSKVFFHEPSAHVPLVMRLPQSWNNRCHSTVNTDLVAHADILPTLVAAAGGEPPADTDGQNLIALAQDKLTAPRQYLEATGGRNIKFDNRYYAITDGRWKYIFYPEGGAEQLFDLENDPRELTNLAHLADFEGKRCELADIMIERHLARESDAVEDGRMKIRPLQGDTTIDRRNRSWPGYHTETYPVDVRH